MATQGNARRPKLNNASSKLLTMSFSAADTFPLNSTPCAVRVMAPSIFVAVSLAACAIVWNMCHPFQIRSEGTTESLTPLTITNHLAANGQWMVFRITDLV
jgi:hypothetical protein